MARDHDNPPAPASCAVYATFAAPHIVLGKGCGGHFRPFFFVLFCDLLPKLFVLIASAIVCDELILLRMTLKYLS